MKRKGTSDELIHHDPLLLIWQQRAMIRNGLFPEGIEASFHFVGGGAGIEVMDGQLIELSHDETTLQGRSLSFRQKPFLRLDFQYTQRRLSSGQSNRHIQRLAGSPSNQLFGGISPMQSKRWLENGLSDQRICKKERHTGKTDPFTELLPHSQRLRDIPKGRKVASRLRGFVLVEAMISLSILTVLGLVLLKMALNVLNPRQWTMQQSVSDAYMTYERALAERVPFDVLTAPAPNSPWPIFPATTSTVVEIGRMPRYGAAFPNGVPIMGTVVRSRSPDPGNYPADGGVGSLDSNPAAIKIWKAQSVLTYRVGNRTYAKSRTVMRSQ